MDCLVNVEHFQLDSLSLLLNFSYLTKRIGYISSNVLPFNSRRLSRRITLWRSSHRKFFRINHAHFACHLKRFWKNNHFAAKRSFTCQQLLFTLVNSALCHDCLLKLFFLLLAGTNYRYTFRIDRSSHT